MLKDSIVYIKNHLKDRRVATIASTSTFSIKTILEYVDFSKDIVIVEYGPGTGVITKVLLSHISQGSKLYAIERNKTLFDTLAKIKDSRLVAINDDVLNIKNILEAHSVEQADYIISGIPFSLLSEENRKLLIKESYNILRPKGLCIIYQFTALMSKYIEEMFGNIEKKVMPVNIPPLILMIARK